MPGNLQFFLSYYQLRQVPNHYLNLLNYASAGLFSIYLYDRFYHQNPELFSELENSQSIGIENVSSHTGVPFDTLFKQWNAALFLSDTGLTDDARYQYQSINLRDEGLDGLIPYPVEIGYNYEGSFYAYTPLVLSIAGITEDSTIRLAGNGAGGMVIGVVGG